jgi:hypothetical protein
MKGKQTNETTEKNTKSLFEKKIHLHTTLNPGLGDRWLTLFLGWQELTSFTE